VLERVEVEGATDYQLVTLYSGLYRLFLYPNSGHENTGTAEPGGERMAWQRTGGASRVPPTSAT
jgi:putative alpha-1,2-mannosidase